MDPKELAAALGRVPSGLFIVSVRTDDVETGMLASWVQQCSFAPPRLTLALQSQREVAGLLTNGARFTLNIVKEGQNDLVSHFSKGFAPAEKPFATLDVDRELAAGPVLRSCLAYLDCVVVERVPAGDHDVLIAEVQSGRMLTADARPWVHIRKNGLRY